MMKVVERRAADNKYLHRDFHISMNMLMEYICSNFGSAALTDYLKQFSREFHAPRNRCLKKENLKCLEKYFRGVYEKEEWPAIIALKDDMLVIHQKTCPGIMHIRKKGHNPIKRYIETYTTIYETMCEGTPYEYIIEGFDLNTGACTQRFQRRSK